jgi:hypothetical protein
MIGSGSGAGAGSAGVLATRSLGSPTRDALAQGALALGISGAGSRWDAHPLISEMIIAPLMASLRRAINIVRVCTMANGRVRATV